MLLNKSHVKAAVLTIDKDLRVSAEFYEGLSELVGNEIARAVDRNNGNPSKKMKTLKKVHLKD
jgi:hypothetical protein